MNSVRNFLCTILLCLCLSPLIHAQALFSRDAEDLQTAAAATGNGTALIVRGWGGAIIQVTGTFSATLTIEGTVDGTNWVTLRVMNVSDGNFVTSVTATGVYAIATAGIETIRARVSAYTSGSVTVKGRGSVAVIARSSGGGSSSLTPGTTAITGGTIGRVFFHDTGDVMGEYPVTGTAGNAVLSVSPNLTGAPTITSTSNPCFAVGPNGATNPTLAVKCDVATEVTGLLISGAATGTNGTTSVTSSGANDGWNWKSKGTGIFRFVPDTAGAGTVVVGSTTDTADAQLSVYSQSTTRPGLKLRALSGTAGSQNVFENYEAGGTINTKLTADGTLFVPSSVSSTTPTLAFGTTTATGISAFAGGALWFTIGSTLSARLQASGLEILPTASLDWAATAISSGVDLRLFRDAANTLAQKNGNADQIARSYGANSGYWERGSISESITLSTSGATTDSTADLLPANAIIEAVTARITTTITIATDWALGDATIAARFAAANSTLTAGTTSVGLQHVDQTGAAGPKQTSAAKLRITTTGTPGAGVIRITVYYRKFVPPTS